MQATFIFHPDCALTVWRDSDQISGLLWKVLMMTVLSRLGGNQYSGVHHAEEKSCRSPVLERRYYRRPEIDLSLRESDLEHALTRYLLYYMMPLWMAAGLLDWYWHKDTDIEHTAGTRESLIHLLMFTEVGVPIILGVVLRDQCRSAVDDGSCAVYARGNGLLGRRLRDGTSSCEAP
jgi:hypothetical protein